MVEREAHVLAVVAVPFHVDPVPGAKDELRRRLDLLEARHFVEGRALGVVRPALVRRLELGEVQRGRMVETRLGGCPLRAAGPPPSTAGYGLVPHHGLALFLGGKLGQLGGAGDRDLASADGVEEFNRAVADDLLCALDGGARHVGPPRGLVRRTVDAQRVG